MRFPFGKKRRPRAYLISQSADEGAMPNGRSSSANSQSRIFDKEHSAECETIYSIPAKQISSKAHRRAKVRIGMVGVCFGVVYIALAVRLADISFSQPLIAVHQTTKSAVAKLNGPRPEIIDRNGVLLATNLPTLALEIAGKEVWDAKETATKIADLFDDVDQQNLQRKLERGQYVEVRSDLNPVEHKKVFALGLPGVRFSSRDHRFYPQEGLAPHLIGYVEKGRARIGEGGIMGLEKVLDQGRGEKPLISSIDVRAQQALEAIISSSVEEFSALAGWGGIMDVQTGEIIALASFPEFNLNDPKASGEKSWRNRMTYDRFDLGSAFKAITAASAIESGVADEATLYDARGVYKIPGMTVKDYKGKNRILTLSEVVQYSSNIGSARMAHEMGVDLQKYYLSELGLFEALPIELSENRVPDLPKKWGPVETATVSYGHGIAITPLHLLAAFSAVINGGVYRVPTFKKVLQVQPGTEVFTPTTSANMRRVLRRTLLEGSAKRAEVKGYFPIGKTSTADKPGVGGYDENARISSFAGAFPGYDPRYVVLVSLDNPQPTSYTYGYATAGWTAAPMFKKLLQRVGPILEVPVIDEQTATNAFFADHYDYDQSREVIGKQDITQLFEKQKANAEKKKNGISPHQEG